MLSIVGLLVKDAIELCKSVFLRFEFFIHAVVIASIVSARFVNVINELIVVVDLGLHLLLIQLSQQRIRLTSPWIKFGRVDSNVNVNLIKNQLVPFLFEFNIDPLFCLVLNFCRHQWAVVPLLDVIC